MSGAPSRRGEDAQIVYTRSTGYTRFPPGALAVLVSGSFYGDSFFGRMIPFSPGRRGASVGVHVPASLKVCDIRNALLDYVLPPVRLALPVRVAIRRSREQVTPMSVCRHHVPVPRRPGLLLAIHPQFHACAMTCHHLRVLGPSNTLPPNAISMSPSPSKSPITVP